jgi:hypothetical protein
MKKRRRIEITAVHRLLTRVIDTRSDGPTVVHLESAGTSSSESRPSNQPDPAMNPKQSLVARPPDERQQRFGKDEESDE